MSSKDLLGLSLGLVAGWAFVKVAKTAIDHELSLIEQREWFRDHEPAPGPGYYGPES